MIDGAVKGPILPKPLCRISGGEPRESGKSDYLTSAANPERGPALFTGDHRNRARPDHGEKNLGHGRFLTWIEDEFKMLERTTQRFLEVFET